MTDVKSLYERLRNMKWPAIAGGIGDFAMYESLLAGYADRAAGGALFDVGEIPIPDDETLAQVEHLRKKRDRSNQEDAFLEYFDLLEEIRFELGQRKWETPGTRE